VAQPAGTSPATAQIPHVPEERLSIQPSDTTCSNVRVQYGFMEDPNVPEALEQAR
jgi:K+ transporter